MILGSEEIAPEADRLNLRFRRQAAAAKAVDAERRAWARHLLQGGLHLVGVVWQGLNLFTRQQVAEGIAAWVEGALPRDPGRR